MRTAPSCGREVRPDGIYERDGARASSLLHQTERFGLPSPDGKYLAIFTANSDVLKIQEIPTGKELQRLAPSSGGRVIQRASFSPDSSLLVISYGPGPAQQSSPSLANLQTQLRIWDVKSGRELRTIVVDSSAFEAGFSSDSRMLATLGSMGQVALWDAGSGSRLRDLKSSPMDSFSSIMGGAQNPGAATPPTIDPRAIMKGSGKPGSMPNIPNMPNMADISSMMTNMMGSMSAGTMGRISHVDGFQSRWAYACDRGSGVEVEH